MCPFKTSAAMISKGGSTAVKAHQKISLHVCTRQEHGKHTIHVHEVCARTGIMIRYSKDIGDTFTFSSTAIERTKHACMHGYGYVSRVIRELGVTCKCCRVFRFSHGGSEIHVNKAPRPLHPIEAKHMYIY